MVTRTARKGKRCAFCGALGTTIEHLIPVSRGGYRLNNNTVAACVECNLDKGDLLLDEWFTIMLPTDPRRISVALIKNTPTYLANLELARLHFPEKHNNHKIRAHLVRRNNQVKRRVWRT